MNDIQALEAESLIEEFEDAYLEFRALLHANLLIWHEWNTVRKFLETGEGKEEAEYAVIFLDNEIKKELRIAERFPVQTSNHARIALEAMLDCSRLARSML